MVGHFGLAVVRAYMQHVQDNAEEAVRRVIDVLKDGALRVRDGQRRARFASRIAHRHARSARRPIDFTGTSAQQPTNFNAPSAVCKAAVLYVFRTLVDDEIPMNAGCLKPLRIVDSRRLDAGAALSGRGRRRQRRDLAGVTDALYGALGVLAASQGTMNNFTFGNDAHQYYETIAGGSGAGPGLRRHRASCRRT